MPPNATELVTTASLHNHGVIGPSSLPSKDENSIQTKIQTNPHVDIVKDILRKVPRRGYVEETSPTPIELMPRLSKYLASNGEEKENKQEGPELYVKRDDMLPLAGGGSKTRKLDYLVQDALDQGAEVLITCGAVQSNHCRLTASAAAREGLECYILLEERVPGSYKADAGGNNYIFSLLGAKQIPVPAGGIAPAQDDLVRKLEAEGKKCYVIPGGGSNAKGALGYVQCAIEIIEESESLKAKHGETNKPGLFWDTVVTCSGSGGTHTGLLTGLRACGYTTPVIGISVRFDSQKQGERIHTQFQNCVNEYFGNSCEYFKNNDGLMPVEDVVIKDDYVGGGYSIYTEEMAEAVQSFARLESILLDPVYTGKTAAGLIDFVRKGQFTKDQRVLFIHTGGAPSTFHYQPLPPKN